MLRRSFLRATTALAAMAATGRAPALAQSAASRTLRFVPFADLGSIDPIWTTGYTTRDHGFLVYDTLYGTDESFRIRPQMAEGHEVSADGKTVAIRLREGLKFHDGEAVRARDCIASLLRWSRRDSFGQAWAATLDEARASDDRTMNFRLKAPFPTFFAALAKPSSNVAFMMPERVAATDPMQQIADPTGSGPFRFLRDQWQSGVQAVYARNPDYVARNEPPSWTAGGKVAHLERIEWKIMRDATTAGAALQSGEIDWYDEVHPDLVPALRRNRNVRVLR